MSQDYLEKDFDFTEKDKKLAQKKIALMAKDLYRFKCAFENHNQIKHFETFKILCKVFFQQCEAKDSKEKDNVKRFIQHGQESAYWQAEFV